MSRVTCLWSTRSREWGDQRQVARCIGNPFEYLTPLLDGQPYQVVEACFDEAETAREILEFDPDVVLISALTAGSERAQRLVQAVREHKSAVKTVWGGWHAKVFWRELLDDGADTVALGPGENLLARYPDPHDIPPGLLDVQSAERTWTHPLKLALGTMVSPGFGGGRVVGSMSAIEGCPRTCRFCAQRMTKYQVRPRDYVEAELASLVDMGATGLFLLDGNPMAHRHAFAQLCDTFAETVGERLPWRVFGDTSSISDEALVRFRRAGGRNIYLGLESPDPALLRAYGADRKLRQAPAAQTARQIQDAGLYVTTSLIVGDPRRREDVGSLVTFLEAVQPDFIALHQLMPVPGTPMWDELSPLLRPGLSWGDLDQMNPDGFFADRQPPAEIIGEIIRRYFAGGAYAELVAQRFRTLGADYLAEMESVRCWLQQWEIDPWADLAPAAAKLVSADRNLL